jgi:hypothetical protein
VKLVGGNVEVLSQVFVFHPSYKIRPNAQQDKNRVLA